MAFIQIFFLPLSIDYHTTIANSCKVSETKSIWMLMLVVLICTLTGVLFGAYLTKTILQQNQLEKFTLDDYHVKIVDRNQWGTQNSKFPKLNLPVQHIIIASTNTENCDTTVC